MCIQDVLAAFFIEDISKGIHHPSASVVHSGGPYGAVGGAVFNSECKEWEFRSFVDIYILSSITPNRCHCEEVVKMDGYY
ncbi:hypothetical protein Tcan_07875 [Toxocara canis]|uniref:Uncharacterized protein n=1 Tax=Toxocara canis TaxID=6265 RepID=A0A0B2VU54_TOXCA|nr:hypothetical protein Tcan_07875 [Toxocara canis]